jgi:hypothetical protein
MSASHPKATELLRSSELTLSAKERTRSRGSALRAKAGASGAADAVIG